MKGDSSTVVLACALVVMRGLTHSELIANHVSAQGCAALARGWSQSAASQLENYVPGKDHCIR